MLETKAINIQKRYSSGQRDFSYQQLRRIDFKKANLKNVNFTGADLSYADLRGADLTGANLSRCYLNEANLTGANLTTADLTGAYLIKAYLTKVNAQKAIFQEAYLTSSFLTRANLSGADLTGTFFNNTYLSGVKFHNAIYSNSTHFDRGINPGRLGMIKKRSSLTTNVVRKTTIRDLIANLEKVTTIIIHYLGATITSRYWEISRPDVDWLQNFSIEKEGKVNYKGSPNDKATSLQIKWLEKWTNSLIEECSILVHDLPKIIEQKDFLAQKKIFQEKEATNNKTIATSKENKQKDDVCLV